MDIKSITIPKTNYSEGRGQYRPSVIVIHIAEGDAQSVRAEFTGNTEKSSHYLVLKTGEVWQFCSENDTAYGNGTVDKPTAKIVLERTGLNPNLYTISIEHEGFGYKDITAEQYKASSELIREISERWLIPLDRTHIIRHREINAGKLCPGLTNVEKLIRMASVNPEEIAETILKTKDSLDKNLPKQEADSAFKRFVAFLLASLGL